jgi:hypothetical protein
MLRDKAVDLVAFRLGQRTDLRDTIIAEMDHLIQTELSKSGHYFLWQRGSWGVLGTLMPGYMQLNMSGVLALDEDTPLSISKFPADAKPEQLYFSDGFYPDIVPNTQPRGIPGYWCWVGDGVIEFDRVADVTYAIYGRAYVTDAPLDGTYGDANNVENRWLRNAPDVVIAAVGRRMSMSLVGDRLFKMFDNDYQKAWNRAYTEDIARREALADRAATED